MPVVEGGLIIPFTVEEEATEPFADRLIERMTPWNVLPAFDGMTAMEIYCRAIAAPFQTILDVAEEKGSQGEAGWVPAWGKLLDPATCPYEYLPYLAMFVGVEIPKIVTETEAREILKAESGLARGTRASLEALLRKALGAVPFIILEREPTAYSLVVVIPVGHVTTAVYEEINLTIPAGIIYQIVEVENSWYAGTKKWSEVNPSKSWELIKEGEYHHEDVPQTWEPWQAHEHASGVFA